MSTGQVVDILGIPVIRTPKADLLREWLDDIRSGGPAIHVVTLNVDLLLYALEDDAFSRAVHRARYVVADGVPLVWYSRMLGRPIADRVNGTDLVDDFAALSERHGLRLFFLGSSQESCLGAIEALRARHPGMHVAGQHQPPFREWTDEDQTLMLTEIRAAEPDVVLVAFGAPRAETWIAEHGRQTGAALLIGIGGSFDILAGRYRRAPLWMQRNGLEWLWRLLQDPRRLARRYLVRDSRFLLLLLRRHLWRTGAR